MTIFKMLSTCELERLLAFYSHVASEKRKKKISVLLSPLFSEALQRISITKEGNKNCGPNMSQPVKLQKEPCIMKPKYC